MTQLNIGHSHIRPRRLRRSASIRDLVAETKISKHDLIAPVFVTEVHDTRSAIASLPGIERIPLAELAMEAERIAAMGLKSILVFPVVNPKAKDAAGKESANARGILPKAIRVIKEAVPHLTVMADVALDPFTTHGHDGILSASGEVLNDDTVAALCEMSRVLAEAGVDVIAPSDMMDGRIRAIRDALDTAQFKNTAIMAYSAKFASAFYGPFREALSSGARGLDKRSYQLSTGNTREALREALLDEAEGADFLMIKPAGCYLDIIHQVRQSAHVPIVAYQVSGEYAMLKAAAQNGWVDEAPAVLESLLSIKRAGADLIVSYYACWAAENLL
jgi:porphobilinogen synthase